MTTKASLLRATGLLIVTWAFVTGASAAGGNEKLDEIHKNIQEKYQALQHLNANNFEAIADDNLIVFDVREQNEFNVSHLSGAIRVDPDISADEFVASFQQITKEKKLVFYCSVGRRSSELASKVQNKLLKTASTPEIYNLEGGIFRWHNDSRTLFSGQQASDFVHPYNRYWGRLIDRPEMIRN